MPRLSLNLLDNFIEEGKAFIGLLVFRDQYKLRFSLEGNEIIEDIPIDWINKSEIDKLNIDEQYYVVEDVHEYTGSYKLTIADLSGLVVVSLTYACPTSASTEE